MPQFNISVVRSENSPGRRRTSAAGRYCGGWL